jgi:hypothetical protein
MSDTELAQLHTAIKRQWSSRPRKKATPYINALAITFIQDPIRFTVVTPKQRKDIRALTDVQASLQSVPLEALLTQLKAKGPTEQCVLSVPRGACEHHADAGHNFL